MRIATWPLGREGCVRSEWSAGRRNAMVLPVPVFACARTSALKLGMSLRVFCWTGDMVLHVVVSSYFQGPTLKRGRVLLLLIGLLVSHHLETFQKAVMKTALHAAVTHRRTGDMSHFLEFVQKGVVVFIESSRQRKSPRPLATGDANVQGSCLISGSLFLGRIGTSPSR